MKDVSDWSWIMLAGVGSATLLLTLYLAFGSRSFSGWSLVAGLGVLAAETLFAALSIRASTLEEMATWQAWSQGTLALIPGPWLLFALTYARGNYREFLGKWMLPIIAAFVIPLSCAPLVVGGGIGAIDQTGKLLEWRYRVHWPALVIHSSCLIAAVAALINLEWTFRSSVGTVRWRIKYAVVGCALLLGTRIYTSSQTILYSGVVTVGFLVFNAAAVIVACLLLGVSVVRSRMDTIDLYPSASAIYRSLTAALIGFYLVLVGGLAEWVKHKGGDAAFPLQALLLFLGIAGLGVMAFSDRLRQRLRLLISRHFARPLYDYRQVWATFTERTAALVEKEAYCQAVVKLVAETFEVLSVSIWLDQERTGLLERGSSTATGEPDFCPGDEAVLAEMRRSQVTRAVPVNIDTDQEPWCEVLRRLNPGRFAHGGHRIAMPLVSGGDFVGVLVLGDRVNGLPVTPDDVDLLKCIGDQVAANLRNLRLAAHVMELREFEAFQMLSTFLVHDLKNTASTLSLMLRNMEAHFSNPAFREDALRGLGKSVDRINDLILRLTDLRQQPIATRAMADLNEVMAAAAAKLDGQAEIEVVRRLDSVPCFLFDPQQMESVFTNLVLNARDAVGRGGRITLSSQVNESWVVASVEDDGCGMTPEFISRSLFRPFQTTKKKGMGIGMFQSKIIVEAHGGRIEVQTTPGKGTVFRVHLPIVTAVRTPQDN